MTVRRDAFRLALVRPASYYIGRTMISLTGLWRRSTSSYHPSPGGGVLVSPASRAKIGGGFKTTVRSPAVVSSLNGGGGGSVGATNGGVTNCSGTYHHHPHRAPGIERYAVLGLLFIAWAWIMVFFGMIFYHGYQYRTMSGGMGAGDRLPPAPMLVGVGETASNIRVANKKQEEVTTIANSPLRRALTRFDPHLSPLLIFTCQRENYLRETLLDILKYIPADCSMGCPVIVSQDGKNAEVGNVITEFETLFQQQKPNVSLVHIQHKSALRKGSNNSYQALAQHYGWALKQVFDGLQTAVPPQRVVILEEDIHIAPDFFGYFKAMAPLLDNDPSLLAVSAFNDNGVTGTVQDVTRVLRSDFFPGLGWMMTSQLWTNELKLRWPSGYWDDWLRDPSQRHERKIIRPEVSRTFHFGTSGGASHNQFGTTLTKVHLNDVNVDWTKAMTTIDDVKSESAFDEYYWKQIEAAKVVATVDAAAVAVRDQDVRLDYATFPQFQQFARHFGLMDDEKAGIPRTAYKGVVETRPHGEFFVFLVPANASFKTMAR
jgi:alpha-1,3-mannosyl-glycoprotein beta-1,2-N-acetylglucosaminyltransferase